MASTSEDSEVAIDLVTIRDVSSLVPELIAAAVEAAESEEA